MNTEQRDTAERVASLERLATRVTRYEGRSSDVIVPVKNLAGADLDHGAAVTITGISAAGVLEAGKPDADSDMQFLGVIVGKLGAGAIGKVQIAGLAEGRRDRTAMNSTAPVAGAHIGTQESSHLLAHDQYGAGRFVQDLYNVDADVAICLILLQHSDRLVTDHRTSFKPGIGTQGHFDSTPVYEPFDFGDQTWWFNGLISDLMSVVPVKSGTSTTYKTALDFRRQSSHNHGWFKGEIIEEGGTGTDVGWGPIADIIGIRGPNIGQGNVDVNLNMAQFNSGKNTLLLGYNEDLEPVTKGGEYVMGWMVPHVPSQTWRPAVPVQYELRSIQLDDGDTATWTRECGEADPCRLLVDPLRYRTGGPGHITGPHDSSTSLCNYLEWIACNRQQINGIFDALWYVSCCFSWKVGEMDSNLQSFATQGQSLDLWIQALQNWGARVTAILNDVQLTALWALVTNGSNAAYENIVWYATDHCGKGPCGYLGIDIPYLLECPYWGQQA